MKLEGLRYLVGAWCLTRVGVEDVLFAVYKIDFCSC